MTAHILIVDDEPRVAEPLSFALQREHFRVTHVERGEQALAVLAADAPALMVLDVGLPDINGFDVLKRVRRDSEVPVLFLTAREDELDRILGLELGADDYLAKPFEPRELQARIKALLRRLEPKLDGDEVLRFGRLEIDLAARVARLDGKICDLTSHQFDLLVVLAQSPGRVLSRDQIMDALKGHPLEAFDRSIDVHISRIRAVIEDDPKNPRRVLTVRGAGYVFARKQDADADAA